MIQLPPSKSIGSRYLVATFFAGTLPADPLFEDNEDLMTLQGALLEVYTDEEPIDYGDSPLDAGASGTALRFLTAVCASCPGADYVINGTPRLMQRPMKPLLEVLKKAGAKIDCLGNDDQGPYKVYGNTIKGGEFKIQADISSQFISALMLVAPSWEEGAEIKFSTPVVSAPYIEMTAKVLEAFGIKAKVSDSFVKIPHSRYHQPHHFDIEPDWSAAAFFFEACVLSHKDIQLQNLSSPQTSMQGDSIADKLFAGLGVNSLFDKTGASLTYQPVEINKLSVDFKDCPDLFLPFTVACLGSDTHFVANNIDHLRFKESDRVAVLQKEAAKLGYIIKVEEGSVSWEGDKNEIKEPVVIDPHEDHRVAMAFAMVAFKTGKITISHPEVVEKSFVDFWNRLPELGLTCSPKDDLMVVEYPEFS